MVLHYCRAWFRAKHVVSEPLTEAEARAAYDARELHTALIGDKDRPTAFLECDGNYIGVEFLDEHLREYVSYTFQERRPGMLFLCRVVFREFIGDEEKVARAVLYYFSEDGQTTVHKEDDVAKKYWEAKPVLNVSANWEPYPKFGEYESISRLDRGLDLVH